MQLPESRISGNFPKAEGRSGQFTDNPVSRELCVGVNGHLPDEPTLRPCANFLVADILVIPGTMTAATINVAKL
jgi:hypothetical protein